MPAGLSLFDAAALAWLALIWGGYTWAADHGPLYPRSLAAVMLRHRRAWMESVVRRDSRIVDAQILGNLVNSVAFFASATILVLGGLAAALGATEEAVTVLADIPYAASADPATFEVKLMLVASVFVYAFFKFAWAYRLFNYGSILVGGAPDPDAPEAEKAAFVERGTRMNTLASRHFNLGIRAYFFALALPAWAVHPAALMTATAFVAAVLYRREFSSKAHATLAA